MNINSLIPIIDKEIEKTENLIKEEIQSSKKLDKVKIELEEYLMLEIRLEDYLMTLSIGGNGQSNINQNQIRTYNNYDKKRALKIIRKKINEKFIDKDRTRKEYIHILNNIFYNDIIRNFNPENSIKIQGQKCNQEVKQSFIFYEKICKIEIDKIDNLLVEKFNIELKKKNKDIKIKKLPKFIIYDFQELLKQEVFIKWSINYRILLKDLILSNN